MNQLSVFLRKEKTLGKTIFPPGSLIFRAFELTPFEQVKVVILGQDPYHGSGQANGLSFSVSKNITIPPSLKNIYAELEDDLGIKPRSDGCLENWAKQGVLLLNSCLTVEQGKPASHQNLGWEKFTDAVLKALTENKSHLVYILWGRYAQNKASLVNSRSNKIIMTSHPSPYSANAGFFGSKPFSATNLYLEQFGADPILW